MDRISLKSCLVIHHHSSVVNPLESNLQKVCYLSHNPVLDSVPILPFIIFHTHTSYSAFSIPPNSELMLAAGGPLLLFFLVLKHAIIAITCANHGPKHYKYILYYLINEVIPRNSHTMIFHCS